MYFSQLRVDPGNDKAVYVAGLPVAKSLDGGRTFATLDDAGGHSSPGHVDQHAIWIDPKNPKHLLIGNDGGFNVSWDQGRTWDFVNTMATATRLLGQRRHAPSLLRLHRPPGQRQLGRTERHAQRERHPQLRLVRHRRRRRLPDRRRSDRLQHRLHGVAGRQHQPLRPAERPRAEHPPARRRAGPRWPWWCGGGGGRGGAFTANVLNASPGEQYRFNWNTPFQLSPHNPSIVWLGGNRLFKSLNRGDTWTASADLTKQIDRNTVSIMGVPGNRTMLSKNDGVVAYSTIVSLSESPVVPGVVWAGTDDGNVQVSRDGGLTFTEVGKNIPGLPRESSLLDLAHRRVALRRRHRLRLGRRPPFQRPQALPVRHARLRTARGRASAATCRRSASSRWCVRIREPRSAVRRHRVRSLRLDSTAARRGTSS